MFFVYALFLMLSLVELAHLWQVQRHDKVLYKFCQIRRDLMKHLRQKGFEMKKDDYLAARELLDVLDSFIHDYNDCKKDVFNFRVFKKSYLEYKEQVEEIKATPLSADAVIKQLRKKTRYTLNEAFLAYTPFFRHELVLKFTIFCVGLLVRAGIKRLEDYQLALRNMKRLVCMEYNESPHGFNGGGLRA